MPAMLAAAVDALHALAMVAWIGGLPLLFWHRYPRLTRVYGVYAILFIVASQASHYGIGECFLTTAARHLWLEAPSPGEAVGEWFTVRFAKAVFHLTPSHRAIVFVSESLILVTSLGVLFSLHAERKRARRR